MNKKNSKISKSARNKSLSGASGAKNIFNKTTKFIFSRLFFLVIGIFLAIGATYIYAAWDDAKTGGTGQLTEANWNALVTMLENNVATERGTDNAALASNYTATRATKIDNLDATVSSRLSAAAYTTERGTDNAALASQVGSPADEASMSTTLFAGLKAIYSRIGVVVYNFANCSQTGATGPSQAQCTAAYTPTTLAGLVTVTDGIQYWAVPSTGMYRIETWGAQGGNTGQGESGGLGARMRGDFALTAGTVLKILVGQQGIGGPNSQSHWSGGGGGGTFVTNTSNTPYIVAGGGGGSYKYSGIGTNGIAGTTSTSGASGGGGIAGGSGGNGGSCSNGGCSAGLTGNGTYGAVAFINGGLGGLMQTSWGDYSLHGGFGGGGGAGLPSGGGGGYSGGGGGTWNIYGWAGGGGSYNNGSNASNSAGVKSGHGQVTITPLY